MTHTHRRRLAVCAIVAAVGCAGAPALAAPAQATSIVGNNWVDRMTRSKEVQFADTHWSWTAWNDATPVVDGADQDLYQCAEFVARSMAAAGLIPGLNPNSPQNNYLNYKASNGKVYDLLLITPTAPYNTIYDYLMDSGAGIDVGDQPALAKPGDFVVTYLGANGVASHMGLIATAPTATAEATVDAHNHARYHYGYHFYAPSHLVELAPNALDKVLAWAAKGGAAPSTATPKRTVTPKTTVTPNPTVTPQHRLGTVIRFADPSGPQV